MAAEFQVPPRDPPPSQFTVFRQSSPPAQSLPNTASGRWNPSDIDEPSVSNNGSVVFYTGNWYTARSADSGLTWTYMDPVAAFPAADGGFCCDQNTIYDPVNNITIWQLLYLPVKSGATAGNNRVRLAVANGQAGVTGNVWHTFDITTANVGAPAGSWLDYPQLGLSQNNLFLTLNGFQGPPSDPGCYTVATTQCIQVNSYAIRIPLTQLAATGTLSIVTFTSACGAFCLDTLSPVQQVGTTMYLGAHGGGAVPDTTIVRVLEWPDSFISTQTPVQHDVAGDAAFTYMLGADGICPSGGGFNTCNRDDSRVKAGWTKNGEVAFAWDARQDGTFPYPYVRAARVNLTSWSLIQDFTIAFQTAAAVYPSIAVNATGALAVTFAEAGGVDAFPKADIGISDTLNPVWEMRSLAAGVASNQGAWWGDYLTIRPASGTANSWVATGYTIQNNGVTNLVAPIFAWFGRQRDDPFLPQGLTCAASLNSPMGAQTTNQLIATFTASSGSVSDYAATIDWSDGTRPTSASASGTPTAATVVATHAFASAGMLTVTVTVADRSGGTATCTVPATITGSVYTTASISQYQLSDSDGSTWRTIDASHLVLKITPTANSTALISANADLWTQNAGINQDIGIAVSGGTGAGTTYPTVAGQPEAWKESGGFAGTFSPNAAYLQTAIPLNAASTYTITLVWKTNKPATGTTIRAGAGPLSLPIPGAYSPIRLTARVIPGLPASNPNFAQKSITTQPVLQNSNGSTWQDMDAGLSQSFMAPSDGTLVIGGNADLWTANLGYNQDLGITVSGGTGAGPTYPTATGQPEAWKESGGYGGTLSPNAAFVQAVVPVKNGVTYQVKLQWKTNRPSGATIVAGAGPGGAFSPTTLTIEFFSSTSVVNAALTASQPVNAGSDGSTFVPIDSNNLSGTVPSSSTVDCVAILGGNADLWTANAGYNQDIATWVNGNLLGWKESGGFAGTFSPNAAYVQSVIPVPMGSAAPAMILQWKTNVSAVASGARIYAGAGPIGGKFSPTRLSAEIICS